MLELVWAFRIQMHEFALIYTIMYGDSATVTLQLHCHDVTSQLIDPMSKYPTHP